MREHVTLSRAVVPAFLQYIFTCERVHLLLITLQAFADP